MAVKKKRAARPKKARGRRPGQPAVRFGTDGWRGVIARDFNRENALLVARALARYLVDFEDVRRGVVVAYDTRFLADRFARLVSEVLTSVGIPVQLGNAATPTPALSYAVRQRQAAAGVMLTASHNRPEWLGIKLKASYGGSASARAVEEVESYLKNVAQLPRGQPDPKKIEVVDLKPAYLKRLAELVEMSRLARAKLRPILDPMHGAGVGYLKQLFAAHGVQALEIRGTPDPLFGGSQPEPTERNLGPLREALEREQCDLGLATDGDADRLAALDEQGSYVSPHMIFSLLFRHLVERRGMKGGVAKTFSVSKMVDRLAEKYGLPLHETPIGFKYIAELMLEHDLLLGGEESGGIGIRPHLPERDGLLNSLLLTEIVATEGKPLSQCVAEMQRDYGPLHYQRLDLPLSPDHKQRALDRFAEDGAGKLGEWTIVGREDLDGVKLYLLNAGWVLVRPSGTEPVLRIYAEAPSKEVVNNVIATVEKLVRNS
ncbi:MAG: phosphoglucomutase/phosphomannomutase family protein [Candidatus Acidoferrales bacterium]